MSVARLLDPKSGKVTDACYRSNHANVAPSTSPIILPTSNRIVTHERSGSGNRRQAPNSASPTSAIR